MPKEEQNNNETQAEIVENQQGITKHKTNEAWYKSGGIGLASGIFGALIVMVLGAFFQSQKQDEVTLKIEALIERIEQSKTDREKEFSRVFNAIADLDNASKNYEAEIANLYNTHQEHSTTIEDMKEMSAISAMAQDRLNEEIDQLKKQIVQFFQASQANSVTIPTEQTNEASEIAELKTQIEALEQRAALLPQLTRRLEEMREARSSLQANFDKAGKRIFDTLMLQDEEIKNLQSDVASLKRDSIPITDQNKAMMIAANNLKMAIEHGGSYENELLDFEALAPDGLNLDLLKLHAVSGIPSITELSSDFSELADKIATMENTLPEEAGLTDRLLHQGSQLYSSRPIGDVEGDGAAAIAARMEVAISKGDIARALNEAQSLPEEAKTIAGFSFFIELLQAREMADTLLSRLIANTLEEEKDSSK